MVAQDFISIKYNGHIKFDVKVNNKANGNFILDTGASGIWIDSLFLEKSGVCFIGENIEVDGGGKSTAFAMVIRDSVDYELSNGETFCSDLAFAINLKDRFSKSLDGAFGFELFKKQPYMIDYLSEKIVFTNSVKDYEPINVKFEDNRFLLPLKIKLKNGNQIEGKFLIDTGSNRTIICSHAFMTDGIYNSTNLKKFYSMGGINGFSEGYYLSVSSVDIGKFKIEKINMSISTDSLGAFAATDYMGIIGNDLLDDFNIIINHQEQKVWLKPNKKFNKNPKKLFHGVTFFDGRKKWIVGRIVENSDAFKQGLRLNDEVVEINGVTVDNIDIDKFVSVLRPNDVLKLKIRRNLQEKTIKFKLNVFKKY